MAEGKGRMDLLPLDVIADLLHAGDGIKTMFRELDKALRSDDPYPHVEAALIAFVGQQYSSMETAILDYAVHMEAGCAKYGDRNWEHGIPVHVYIDSAARHCIKYLRGDTDEPHKAAVVWNLGCCLWTIRHKCAERSGT